MPARTTPDDIIWEPYGDYLEMSNVRRFMDAHGIASYDELVGRSTASSTSRATASSVMRQGYRPTIPP